ncbi:MAG TPA: hypothetical protein VF605_15895 [Allosphingosinicella sp.]|jgi:hypothetical protein
MGHVAKAAALAAMMLCSGGVARAQDPPPRPLELSATAAFTHEHSRVELPPVLRGLPRIEARENEPGQLHISFQYASPDRGEAFIVIIYRDVGGGLPVWFDRARRRVERGAEIGAATLHRAGPFFPPRRTNASGLLATYGLAGKGYRSSGVALVPAGEWLVTLWAASRTEYPPELEARLKAALFEIVWPEMEPAREVDSIAACTTALAFPREAEPVPRDKESFARSYMGAVVDAKLIEPLRRVADPPRWCRDSIELDNAGVYRADEQTDGYFLAINDSGRGIRVRRNGVSLSDQRASNRKDQSERYEVQAIQMSKISTSSLLDRLPPPAQALAIVMERRLEITFLTWGEGRGRVVAHEAPPK